VSGAGEDLSLQAAINASLADAVKGKGKGKVGFPSLW
jgi:hypothetical protein